MNKLIFTENSMKLFLLLLSIVLSICGCMDKKTRKINSSGNNVDNISNDSSINAITIRDSMKCGTVVRVLVGDTIDNEHKKPVLFLQKQKNETDSEWIKTLQAINVQSDNDINVYFRYAQPINGYTVTCRFMPFDTDSETGRIIMRFQGKKSEFLYIKEEKYSSFYTVGLIFNEENSIRWQDGDIYVLDYIPPTFEDFYKDSNPAISPLGYYTPFQFLDIDFDSEKELLINQYCMLQQGNEYEIYKIKGYELSPIHNHLPFSMIDNMTRIDADKKRIVIYIHDGVFLTSYIYFTRMSQYRSHIKELPKFNWDYIAKIMTEYKRHPNYFSIDSIREIVGDTIFEYHRSGTKLKLVKCKVNRNK